MIRIEKISKDKKAYLDLLLLADEDEKMIDRYLERGELFVLLDPQLACVCVVTNEGEDVFEIKNIATCPDQQRKGYGKKMIQFVREHYKDKFKTLLVGTGETPQILGFYESCGFEYSHRIKNFFTDNYPQPIIEDGVLLRDMIYLKIDNCEFARQLRKDIGVFRA